MKPDSSPAGPAAKAAVIIPYFQREPGLLCTAIESVWRQRNGPPARVIVVDDGSPLPAEQDLERCAPEARAMVEIVRQPNRGVAAARNAGLDRVPPTADWIAFLDADDAWAESHLSTAAEALDRGYDFFFADNRRDDGPKTLFQLAGLSPADHRPIDAPRDLYEFDADLFTTVLTYSPIITSTVVYRRRGHDDLRFRETYRTYEDSLFWLHFRDARIAFCSNVQVFLGRGVNISKRPDDWRTNRSLEILRDIDGMYRLIAKELSLTGEQEALLRRLRQRNSDAVARTVVAMTRKGVRIDRAVVKEVMGGSLALYANCLRVLAMELTQRVAARF